ncbi:MAG: P-II family nitrogen regulator [Oscillospiraceae bacterium]|jgi:nitrogen regulatory protein PII|nr:P-II family nitrogen regulator [Oscillospiraceae bacterium]
MPEYELICCVVNREKGSRVLKIAKRHGVRGGTILVARGTARSKLLDVLDLTDLRRELVLMAADRETARGAAERIAEELHFNRPNHGIAFTIPLERLIGASVGAGGAPTENRAEETYMYQSIFTIVDKGAAEAALDAARRAGARGGTVLHARGSGVHETEMLFAMPIEPEKEVVLILAEAERADAITGAIREALHIDEPGRGVIFTVGTSKTYGLQ